VNRSHRRLLRLELAEATRQQAEASRRNPEPQLPPELVAYLHHGPHAPLPPDLRAGVDLFLAEQAAAANPFRGVAP
jgi:hypothetical protein